MARTRDGPRLRPRPTTSPKVIRQIREFELKIRKYYPKNLRFFQNAPHYQASFLSSNNPSCLVPQRYKRDIFRSFYAYSLSRVSKSFHLPHNLRHLKIFARSRIILRKLIKQNKRLESLDLASQDGKTNAEIVKHLKYSKSLRSIRFQSCFPLLSARDCRKILRTWGKTIEKINIGESKNEANIMEMILQLPKLKEFQSRCFNQSLPYDKLQERNIAYRTTFGVGNGASLESFLKDQPKFKLCDYVSVKRTWNPAPDTSKKMCLERSKMLKRAKRIHFLSPGDFRIPLSLKSVFQNVLSLDLIISGDEWASCNMGQLNNLKHLSIDISYAKRGKRALCGDFFRYLNENVAPHKKLETFLIKTSVWGQKKLNENPALCFFEACSETLRKVHLELKYHKANSEEAEWFYEGLSKLKNLKLLSLSLDFQATKSNKTIENICQMISKIKTLDDLDFSIQKKKYEGKVLNLRFPPQLKKLGIGMNTSNAPFNASKTLGSLSNLHHLELEFTDFRTQKWSKLLHDIIDRLKSLEVLVLKKTQESPLQQLKERLNTLMKESSNLKLIILANTKSEEMMIFRRHNYSWSDINPVVNDISFDKNMKVSYIKSYQ